MDYSAEPIHSALLNVQQSQPFNAEPPASALVEFSITPEDLVYCRNHGPVREFDDSAYSIVIKGGDKGKVQFSLTELKAFPKTRIVAALQASSLLRWACMCSYLNWGQIPSVQASGARKWGPSGQCMAFLGRTE